MFGSNYLGGPYFGQGWPGQPTPETPVVSTAARIILVDARLAIRIGGIIHQWLH